MGWWAGVFKRTAPEVAGRNVPPDLITGGVRRKSGRKFKFPPVAGMR